MHVSSIDRKSRKVIKGPCGLWLLNDLKGPPDSNEHGPNEKWGVNKLQEWWDRTDRPNRRFGSSFSTELIARMATYKCNLSSSLMASCSQSSNADVLVQTVRHKNAESDDDDLSDTKWHMETDGIPPTHMHTLLFTSCRHISQLTHARVSDVIFTDGGERESVWD